MRACRRVLEINTSIDAAISTQSLQQPYAQIIKPYVQHIGEFLHETYGLPMKSLAKPLQNLC